MKKLLISLVFGVFSFLYSQAQNEAADIGDQIFGFVTRLNKEIDSFFLKEKAESAHRLVGYFKDDLTVYLKVRRTLLDSLKKWDFKASNSNLKLMQQKLQANIGKLKKRLTALIPLISDQLGDDAVEIIDMIDGKVIMQQVYVSKLQQIIDGYKVERLKKGVIAEGEAIHKNLTDALAVAIEIRKKLKAKFNFK